MRAEGVEPAWAVARRLLMLVRMPVSPPPLGPDGSADLSAGALLLAPNLGLPFACVVRLELEGTELRPRAATETGSWVRSQTLTTRSNCSIMRASSGGVIQLAFIHSSASSVAPRATAHPFQT